MLLIFFFTVLAFAQEETVFIPDEQAADTTVSDSLFSVEVLDREKNTEAENFAVEGVSATIEILKSPKSSEKTDTVKNIETTKTETDSDAGEMEITSEILLSIDSENQILVCDFLNNSNTGGRIIELVNLTGNLIFEISVPASENSINFPLKEFELGIYIVRILSAENRSSIFSKAIVIG